MEEMGGEVKWSEAKWRGKAVLHEREDRKEGWCIPPGDATGLDASSVPIPFYSPSLLIAHFSLTCLSLLVLFSILKKFSNILLCTVDVFDVNIH